MADELKELLEAMRQENAAAHAETRRHSQEVAAETRRHSEEVAAETRRHSDELLEAMRQENAAAHAETRRHSQEVAAETRRHSDELIEAMRQENAAAHAETRRHSEDVAAETRRHFDVVAEDLVSRIDTVAEGVVNANERIDRLDAKVDALSSDMADEFSNVRSMIKFSHHELDRRLRMLEEIVADLQSRVDRLESSTH